MRDTELKILRETAKLDYSRLSADLADAVGEMRELLETISRIRAEMNMAATAAMREAKP